MKGLGTDEKAIIAVLANRTTAQRLQIATMYKGATGRDLLADLKSELDGHLEDAVVAMMTDHFVLEANSLRAAMKGAGTDEQTLIELILTKQNDEMAKLKAAYSTSLHRDLEKDIVSETSGSVKHILVSALQGARPSDGGAIDMARVKADTKALLEAGERCFGTDESKFNEVFLGRSFSHVRAVFQEYERESGHSIIAAIDKEMSGSLKDAFTAVAQSIVNRPAFFATQVYKSMKGAGTDDAALIRLIVTRSEIDLEDVKHSFVQLYGKTLGSFIADDCGGDYKRILLALCKE